MSSIPIDALNRIRKNMNIDDIIEKGYNDFISLFKSTYGHISPNYGESMGILQKYLTFHKQRMIENGNINIYQVIDVPHYVVHKMDMSSHEFINDFKHDTDDFSVDKETMKKMGVNFALKYLGCIFLIRNLKLTWKKNRRANRYE